MRTSNASLTWLALAALGLGGACGGGAGDDAAPSPFVITVTVDPDPPVVGENTLFIEVHDAGGAAVTGAEVTVDPQMPAHGHGSPDVPKVTELGDGRYQAFPVTLTMPGAWEVTVTVRDPATGQEGQKVLEWDIE